MRDIINEGRAKTTNSLIIIYKLVLYALKWVSTYENVHWIFTMKSFKALPGFIIFILASICEFVCSFALTAFKTIKRNFTKRTFHGRAFFDFEGDIFWVKREWYMQFIYDKNMFYLMAEKIHYDFSWWYSKRIQYEIEPFLYDENDRGLETIDYFSLHLNCYHLIFNFGWLRFNFNELKYFKDEFIYWYRRGKKKQAYFNIRFLKNKRDASWFWLYR